MSSGSTVSDSGEGASPLSYDEAVRQVWLPLAADGGVRELVRAGTLAANSHNTQPWQFSLADHKVTVHPDLTRRCPAVDPDDHLFASLGCAVENMVQAAPVLGFDATPAFNASNDGAITLALERRQPTANPLADAIVRRQCTRADYDGRAIDTDDLARLEAAGSHEGVTCLLIADRSRMAAIAGHVVEGNTAQMRDPAFMAELKAWIRFNDRMALAYRDGLTIRASGNPSLPAWLARLLLPLVMTEKGEAAKITCQIGSSAGIAVFAAASDDRAGWIAAGRAYQRFALEATAQDIRHAFINQPVEVQTLRPQIAAELGLGNRRPDLVVRFGRGPATPRSLRRPLSAVIERP